jgi:surface protein
MTAALSTETSARVSAVASVSGALSAASVSFAAVDVALSDALSAEAVTRNSAIVSVSQAVSSTAAVLSATDTTLSTALSAEVSARQSGVVSVESAASLAFAGFSLSNAAVNTALIAETSARASTVASASSAIAASFASLQSTDAALKSSASALSAGLALKATVSYVDARLNTLLSGAPAQLDTLAEMAAALGNNPSFASSITAALLTKGTVADVNSLSLQVAAKAALSEFNSVQGVANNAASSASLSAVISNANTVNATVGALASTISALRVTGGTVNASTIAVNGVDIPTLTTRIQELYYKLGTANPSLGTVNPDGTINYKLNRLANPTLVSSVLGFEYAAGGAINKVNHVITVQFDKDQKSVTVTGGPGNPTTTINNLELNSNNRYTFTVAYTGDLAFYEANKTAVSIFALESPYKSVPLVPTVTTPALMLPFLSLNANTVTVQYTGNAVDVPTAAPLFFQANPRGTGVEWFAVVKQGMKAAISDYAGGTSGPFIPPGQSVAVPFNNIVTTLMTDMSSLFTFKSSFNDLIESWDTGAVTNMSQMFYYATGFNKPIGAWNTGAVTTMSNMFVSATAFNQPIGAWNTGAVINMSYMFYNATVFNQPIGTWNTGAVTTMGNMFSYATAFNQPIGTWNTGAVTNLDHMFYGATVFNQNISGWNVGAVVTKPPTNFSNGSALTAQNNPFGVAFAAPTIYASGGITYSGNTVNLTYAVAAGVTAVQVRKASDGSVITSGVTASVSGTTAFISLALTENVSIVVVALGNDNGRESAASAQQALLVQFAAPTISAGGITYSGNTASMTYAVAAGVTAVQVRKASDGTVITSGVTTSVNTSNQTAAVSITFSTTISIVIVALGNANGRESLPSISQTLIGQYAAPTLINSVTYSGNTASMTYSVDLGVTALTVLKSDLTALPAGVVADTTINNGSSGRTVSLSLAFTTSMTIVVIAQGNANGSQSAASAPLALVGNFAKPTLSGSITYSGNTASMTYAVASGVTAVSVLQPNLSALPSGATVTTNAVSGTTATLQISLSDSRGSLSFVVVAVGNSNGRQSASDTQTIYSSGISDITFTKSSNLWYFGFNCNDPASVSGLSINIQWDGRVWFGGGWKGNNTNWVHDYSSSTISTGANSFLIDDPGYLNNMFVGNTARVSINYSVSGVSKNIATTFIPNPLTGGPYVFGISNINTTTNPVTCTLTIPAALEQQRVSQNRGWAYQYSIVNAITNEVVIGGTTFVSNQAVSGVALNLPSSTWGKQLRHRLTIGNDGTSFSGNFIVQNEFTSNDVFTIPLPTGMFPVTVRSESSIGMNWQTPFGINDIRLWGVAWDVLPSALDVASSNYVSKVRIRMKRSTDSTWRFTGAYNYADGIGYAMFHTGVYTSQGQFLGQWTIELRSENADGTITTNYSTFAISYGLASYNAGINNLTQLASNAGGYTILYGDNVTNLF